MITTPPEDSRVDTSKLARTFRHTTNSYKYLFFISLIDSIAETKPQQNKDNTHRIPLEQLATRMVELAWQPVIRFKLSFGQQDVIPRLVRNAPNSDNTNNHAPKRRVLSKWLQTQFTSDKNTNITRYVPYRWLTPFIPSTRRIPDQHKNALITQEAKRLYETGQVPYKIEEDCIVVHPIWEDYFRNNYRILRGWASYHFIQFIERRNPHMPGIPKKLFPPDERESLKPARTFWDRAFSSGVPRICFYTQRRISIYELDHFVPWSFVVHHELWNLVPADPSVNAAKQDRLPPRDLLPHLAKTQANALFQVGNSGLYKTHQWEVHMTPYITTLHVPQDLLLPTPPSKKRLTNALEAAYQQRILPIIDSGAVFGFEPWEFPPNN